MLAIGRAVRPHPSGGEQLLVDDLALLEDRERDEIPVQTLHLFERWGALRAPSELAWADELLRHRRPVLERASFDARVYWTVRLPVFPSLELLARPCFGADGVALGSADLPAPLGWLASTLGTVDVVAEQSGTAPWGQTLAARRQSGLSLLWDDEESLALLPEGSDAWVSLYEVDGDVLFADVASGAAYWVGAEWTGDAVTAMPVGWQAAMHFVLWRLLDGGAVRPSDLAMLAAATIVR